MASYTRGRLCTRRWQPKHKGECKKYASSWRKASRCETNVGSNRHREKANTRDRNFRSPASQARVSVVYNQQRISSPLHPVFPPYPLLDVVLGPCCRSRLRFGLRWLGRNKGRIPSGTDAQLGTLVQRLERSSTSSNRIAGHQVTLAYGQAGVQGGRQGGDHDWSNDETYQHYRVKLGQQTVSNMGKCLHRCLLGASC